MADANDPGRKDLGDMGRALLAPAFAALLFVGAVDASPRSHAARAEFKRANPCPSTGKTSAKAACPGWQIDHVVPLKCGGDDAPTNMQWLTVADHNAKTKAEAKLCRRTTREADV